MLYSQFSQHSLILKLVVSIEGGAMTNHLAFLGFVTLLVTIDNALLCGLLLPHTSRQVQGEIATVVGTALGITQGLTAMGIGRLLDNQAFRIFAIVVLVWMCIQTLTKEPMRHELNKWGTTVTVFICTLFGDLGNIIWLGSVLKGNYVALIVFTICLIPVFVVVSLFLAEQSKKYHWMLFVGAAMMAWIAASLCMETAVGRMLSTTLAPFIVQVLFAVLFMALALKFSRHRRIY